MKLTGELKGWTSPKGSEHFSKIIECVYVLCTSSYNSLNHKSDRLISLYSKTAESSINPLTPKSD